MDPGAQVLVREGQGERDSVTGRPSGQVLLATENPAVSARREPTLVTAHRAMLLAIDVHYTDEAVTTGAVGFASWADAVPSVEWVHRDSESVAPYEPGQFYRRELPYAIRATIAAREAHPLDAIVVDAHVWLEPGRPGLGAHLFAALGGAVPVVGVAKSAYREGVAIAVLRGESRSPLWVTAEGCDPAIAAQHVRAMHGPHRIPTLLKRADHLARGLATSRS
ncbi:MAG TPA: endonuclease V [Kofleriaceae bacterium]|nr:endonuclease V [Kofleriaceae bacterium]